MDRIPTTDYTVVGISGHSNNNGAETDIMADRTIEGWRFSRADPAKPHHRMAVPDDAFRGKHRFETWKDEDGLFGRIFIVVDQREIELDSGPIRLQRNMSPNSEHMIFTIRGEKLTEITMECKPIPDPSQLPGSKSQIPNMRYTGTSSKPPEVSLAEYLLAQDKKKIEPKQTEPVAALPNTESTETISTTITETVSPKSNQPTEMKGKSKSMKMQGQRMEATPQQRATIEMVVQETLLQFPDCKLASLNDSSDRKHEAVVARQIVAHILKHHRGISGTLIQRRLAPNAKNSGAIYNAAEVGEKMEASGGEISTKIRAILRSLDAKIGPFTKDSAGDGNGHSDHVLSNPSAPAKSHHRTTKLRISTTPRKLNQQRFSLPAANKPIAIKTSVPTTSVKQVAIFTLWLQQVDARDIADSFGVSINDVHSAVVHVSAQLGDEVDGVTAAIQNIAKSV